MASGRKDIATLPALLMKPAGQAPEAARGASSREPQTTARTVSSVFMALGALAWRSKQSLGGAVARDHPAQYLQRMT
jgi:hypothetical protein